MARTFAVIVAVGICVFGRAQDNPPTPSQDLNTTSATPTDTPYVLHVTSREVVVDVVAIWMRLAAPSLTSNPTILR
jgi:hypothetical protein